MFTTSHFWWLSTMSRRKLLRIAGLLILLLLFFLPTGVETASRVTRIIDGDTLEVLTADNEKLKVRLEGIDTPERDQPFGDSATLHLTKLAHDKPCVLVSSSKDQYGRTLADVLVDGKSLNLQMVEAGLAWHYVYYNKEQRFADAEAMARGEKIGLWKDAEPVPPWEWRKMSKEERGGR
jgi:micrococcal nuclease